MKLKKLHIDSYRQLENLEFDFTYPDGHGKAGEPLEKICIVGQSATGKTSVLELIKNAFIKLDDVRIIGDRSISYRKKGGEFEEFQLDFEGQIEFTQQQLFLRIESQKIFHNKKEFINHSSDGTVKNLTDEKLRLLYFSSDIISSKTIGIFNQNPLSIVSILSDTKKTFAIDQSRLNYTYEFLQNIDEGIWFSLLSKILDYRKRFTQLASELINKGAIGDVSKMNKEYSRWAATNENPLISFAKYFNPVLQKLHLEIDLVNTEYSIPIKSKITDEVFPISGLSTGTKGLLLSMFPLFEIDTDDSLILIDEPERSLFPDMQIDLMGHYKHIAPNTQFIVATHSPFIAAAFEPEERFILYFDDKGKVAVRRGESPIGDDPNDILRNDFNVDYYNDFGKKAYKQYVDLKRKLSQETESEKKKELLVELTELGDKYNF